MQSVQNFRILFTPAPDLPGQWLGHCLDLDLMTQADSVDAVRQSMLEVVALAVAEDLTEGLDPFEVRHRAPDPCWEMWSKVMSSGQPMTSIPREKWSSVRAIASQLQIHLNLENLSHKPVNTPASELQDQLQFAPPAWQLAALQEMRSSQQPLC